MGTGRYPGTQYPGTPSQKQNQNYNVETWGQIQTCDLKIQ